MEQALHAYLDPLLQKHTAGQLIVYEDLLSSWNSCQAVLQQQGGDDTIAVGIAHTLQAMKLVASSSHQIESSVTKQC